MSHPHIVRLFPMSCLILITDSLILLEPLEAARILRWYRCVQLPMKPTWKLVTRPSIKDWVLASAEARSSKKEANELMQVYQEFWYLLHDNEIFDLASKTWIPKPTAPLHSLIPDPSPSTFNSSIGTNPSSSKSSLDLSTLTSNDDFLAEYFAGYALVNAESYRRFHIIAAGDHEPARQQRQNWRNKWQHVEVHRSSEYVRTQKIPDVGTLAREADKALGRWNAGVEKKMEGVEREMRDLEVGVGGWGGRKSRSSSHAVVGGGS